MIKTNLFGMKTTYFITGGTGFIGQKLRNASSSARLLSCGYYQMIPKKYAR